MGLMQFVKNRKLRHEIKQLADKNTYNNIILTDDVQLSLNPVRTGKNLNVCVIGGAGTGKTRNYVLPNILQANTSYVIIDKSGYLLNSTGKFLKEQGYVVKVFNLNDTETVSCDYKELCKVGDVKTAIFIVPSMTNCNLSGELIVKLFFALYNRVESLPNNRLPVHVRFIFDEFGNSGHIPDFEKHCAVCGKFNMSVNIILQNFEQLKLLYEYSDIILGNCDSRLYLGGLNIGTLKHISETVGSQMSFYELATIDENNKCVLNIRGLPTFYGEKYDVEKHINYDRIEK